MNSNDNRHSDEPDCCCQECEYKGAVARAAAAAKYAEELKRGVVCSRLETEVLRLVDLICASEPAMCMSAEPLEIQKAYATLDTLRRILNGPEEALAYGEGWVSLEEAGGGYFEGEMGS